MNNNIKLIFQKFSKNGSGYISSSRVKRMLNIMSIDFLNIDIKNQEYNFEDFVELLKNFPMSKDSLLANIKSRLTPSLFQLISTKLEQYSDQSDIKPILFQQIVTEAMAENM